MVLGTKSVNKFNSSSSKARTSSNIEQVGSSKAFPSDPQVKATRSPRRQFTNAYKLQFLTSYDACANASERGELLRREGLYYARVSSWRRQLGINEDGKKTSSKARRTDHMAREIEQLKKKLAQAEAIIDLQKKSQNCLGHTSSLTTATR